MRQPVSAVLGDKRITAVYDRLITTSSDAEFSAVLDENLRQVLGQQWISRELARSPDARHPIMLWRQCIPAQAEAGLSNTGALLSVLRLAYDLFQLDDNSRFQQQVLDRLRNYDNFQGARHELAVAAALVAAGFSVDYPEDEPASARPGRKVPDFFALHKATGERIAVEAKSKKRDGVLGFRAQDPGTIVRQIGIKNHLQEAQLKDPSGLPLLVCVDANAPYKAAPDLGGWTSEISSTIAELEAEQGPGTPASGYLITNDPCHHHLDEVMDLRTSLWAVGHLASSPQVAFANPRIVLEIAAAFMKRARIPKAFPVQRWAVGRVAPRRMRARKPATFGRARSRRRMTNHSSS